jgi:divinyl chlorophyllide a 8-vinyl-reductase
LNAQLPSSGSRELGLGTKSDAYAIDYQATLNCIEAAQAAGARHFVLLSAFCVKSAEVRDPDALQFQYAKLKVEGALASQSDVTWTSVRPTAFFKSVSGQLEVVQAGAPFVYFDLGNGRSATCNPISEADLAVALIDTIAEPSKVNQVWNVGGPDEGMSMETQGGMLAGVLGKEPKLLAVPIGLFDVIIGGLQGAADLFKGAKLTSGLGLWFDDAAELGRIGKYYAVVDMLTTDQSERFGTTTLGEHYAKIAVEGQEYDPYTTMFSSSASKKT